MKDVKLINTYIRVMCQDGLSYGGNQEWFSSSTIKGYGCGLIGAVDVLVYLISKQEACVRTKHPTNPDLDDLLTERSCYENVYQSFVSFCGKRHFPILPRMGISGWLLALGLRRCFRKYRLPYKVCWGVPRGKMLAAIEEMLLADIPVIISVGPNFPCLWGRRGVPLYRKLGEGRYINMQGVRAHYMVVTAIVGGKLRVSTWGQEYYLDWKEYCEYTEKYSCYLFSNICYIKWKDMDKQKE